MTKRLCISTPACPDAVVLVDDEDWDFVKVLRWTPARHGRTMYAVAYGRERVYMHRQILRARIGEVVDHINGNGLDNRKGNLRFCTLNQNGYNRIARNGNSKYLGVHKLKGKEVWVSNICHEKKRYRLGRFKCEIEAARARDEMAKKLHGEFAQLNFPDG